MATFGNALIGLADILGGFSPQYMKKKEQDRSLAELAQVATGQNIPNFRRSELGNPAAINQEMQRNLSAAMIRNPETAGTSLAALLDTPERQMARQQLALQQQNAAQEQAVRQQTLALQRQQEERLAAKDNRCCAVHILTIARNCDIVRTRIFLANNMSLTILR